MTTTIAMPKSPGEPQVKGPEWNDRDRINDVLTTEKYLTTGYNVGLNEMQNPQLRETVRTILNETHKLQESIFDQMFQKGWYKMKAADNQEVFQAHTQFANYRSQFPSF
jgi:spore coat protein CotF